MDRFSEKPFLGFGLGLRSEHYESILSENPPVDWFEIISENYLVPGGKPHYYLNQIQERYPLVMHGVSLSIGSTDPLDFDYLQQLKTLAKRVKPVWISDHLCWTGVQGLNMHDLLPLPYTEEAVRHVVARIRQVQDYLEQPILNQNASTYVTYKQSEMTEWQFLTEIVAQAGCYILLDINNIYVSSVNHAFNPLEYVSAIPKEKVIQIHLAGHSHQGNCIIDTHDAPVVTEVWDLYAQALQHLGPTSTMIERDDDIPPLSDLLCEMQYAKKIAKHVLSEELAL